MKVVIYFADILDLGKMACMAGIGMELWAGHR